MNIKPFAVEEWMNAWEVGAKYNIAETCVDSVSLNELFELTGEDRDAFLHHFCQRRLTYGDIEGAPDFKSGICKLYHTISPGEVVPTHGATGANHHVFYSLIQPGDRVISIMPTYQHQQPQQSHRCPHAPRTVGADCKDCSIRGSMGAV